MPTISMFYGIIIRKLSIPDGNLLEGDFPAKKLRLVQAWIAIHEEELMADWALAVNGEPVFPIARFRWRTKGALMPRPHPAARSSPRGCSVLQFLSGFYARRTRLNNN